MKKMAHNRDSLGEIADMVRHIKEAVEELPTREEFDEFRREMRLFREETGGNFRNVHQELRDIKTDLLSLREKVRDNSGFTKEIDHALQRIATIEKHLGIKPKAHI